MSLCLKYGAYFKIWPLTLSTCMFWLALDTLTETFVHVQTSDCLTDCKLRAVICFLCAKTRLVASRSWFSILPIPGKRIGIDRWMSIPQWRIDDRIHSVIGSTAAIAIYFTNVRRGGGKIVICFCIFQAAIMIHFCGSDYIAIEFLGLFIGWAGDILSLKDDRNKCYSCVSDCDSERLDQLEQHFAHRSLVRNLGQVC